VAARPQACAWGRSLAAIVGSNPGRRMGVCLLSVLCVFRWRSDHSPGGVLRSVVRLCVIVQSEQRGGPCHLQAVVLWKENLIHIN